MHAEIEQEESCFQTLKRSYHNFIYVVVCRNPRCAVSR